MLKTIKDYINHPYGAPLREPAKLIGDLASLPARGLVLATRDTWKEVRNYGANPFSSFFTNIEKHHNFLGFTLLTVATGVAACYAAVTAGLATAGAAAGAGVWAQNTLMVVGGAMGFAGGLVATPFLACAAVTVVASAAALAVGLVPGLVSGMKEALAYKKTPLADRPQFSTRWQAFKNQPKPLYTPKRVAKLAQNFAKIVDAAEKENFIRESEERFPGIMQAVKEKLAADFEAAAERLKGATVLSEGMQVRKGPLKVLRSRQSPT